VKRYREYPVRWVSLFAALWPAFSGLPADIRNIFACGRQAWLNVRAFGHYIIA